MLGMVQERNHRQTDAICIENNTKKVIVTVTSEDDKIAQRHEKLGTVYKYRTLGSEKLHSGNIVMIIMQALAST